MKINQLIKQSLIDAKKNLPPPDPTPIPTKGKRQSKVKSPPKKGNVKGNTPIPQEDVLEGSLTEEQHNNIFNELSLLIEPNKELKSPPKYDVLTSLQIINKIGKLFVNNFNEIEDETDHIISEWLFSILN